MSARWEGLDDEDFEETETDVDWGGRDGVIFLIDATKQMFDEEEGDCHFLTALKCCHMTMLNKIIGSSMDLVSVVLFGTNNSANKLNVQHVTILQELQQPNIEAIKDMEAMINSKTFGDFDNKHGHSNAWKLHEALWVCQFLFAGCPMKMGVQRILLFTSCDQPQIGSPGEQQRALDRATDLRAVNISLELLPLGRTFRADLFYKDLIEAAVGEEYAQWSLLPSENRLEELLTRCCRYSHKKRTQSRVLFHLGPGVSLGLGVYSMIRRRPMPRQTWVERRNNQTVQASRHYLIPAATPAEGNHEDEEENGVTAEPERMMDRQMQRLLPMKTIKFQKFGGEKIVFDPLEVPKLRQLADPGFHLMGFKPRFAIPLELHFKKPVFLFPDESQVIGSRRLFAALLDRCIAKEVVALCWGVLRRNYPPHFFALFPHAEVIDPETGYQESPGGFHAFQLPTTENIRNFSFIKMEDALPEQFELMNKVVQKLSFRYKVHNFHNPKLQMLWAGIEALALDLKEPREVTDETQPKYKEMKKALGDLGPEFNDTFYPEGFEPTAKRRPAAKRAAEGGASGRAAKAIKQEDIDVEELAKTGKVESLKVDQLKAFLQEKGEKVAGKRKADLVTMVYRVTDCTAPS